MISSKRNLQIELNNTRYVINLVQLPENLRPDTGIELTFFIRSINNHRVSSETFFNVLKKLVPYCILSIYLDDRRIIAEHLNSHIHLNFGNTFSIRSNATFVIEWQIRIVGEM